jgi:hypothetical protein
MAGYLGQKPAVNGIYTVDEFTSSGGTTYTLSRAPGTKNNIQVNAGGLAQYPSAYSVSGTTLTLSGVPSGQKVVVRHMGETILYPALDDNIVTNAKLADDAVGLAELSATGTASSSNFLRGDNSWQAAGGGAWNVIKSTSISSVATVNFVHGTSGVVIDSTYEKYILVGSHVILNTAGGISVRLSSDAGSSWYSSSNYDHTSETWSTGTYVGAVAASANQFDITVGVEAATGHPTCFTVEFYNLSQSTNHKPIQSRTQCIKGSGQSQGSMSFGSFKANNAINGIQVLADGGAPTLVSGRLTLYGIAHA